MKRMALFFAISLLMVTFFAVGIPGAVLGEEKKEHKTVEIPLAFSKQEDGMQGAKPIEGSGWMPLPVGEKVPDDAEVIYEGIIKVYKVNPCYVCVGGRCYWVNC